MVVLSDMVIIEKCLELFEWIGFVDGVLVFDLWIFVYYYCMIVDGWLMFGKGGNMFLWCSCIVLVFDCCLLYEV